MTAPESVDLPEPTLPITYYCNKCGYMGSVGESHPGCDYFATSSGPYWDRAAVERLWRDCDRAELAVDLWQTRFAKMEAERDALRLQIAEMKKRYGEEN